MSDKKIIINKIKNFYKLSKQANEEILNIIKIKKKDKNDKEQYFLKKKEKENNHKYSKKNINDILKGESNKKIKKENIKIIGSKRNRSNIQNDYNSNSVYEKKKWIFSF